MTAVNPLFEFMPYGAPELISAQRSHQTRALVLASGVAIIMFALALMLDLRVIDPMPVEVSLRDRRSILENVRQSIRLREPAPPRAEVQKRVDPRAIPVPVPEVDAPPTLPIVEDVGQGSTTGGTVLQAGDGTKSQAGAVIDDVPPTFGDPPPDVLPELVVSVTPKYSDLARDANIEGRVAVRMLIGKDGRVMRAEIDPKFSVPMLNESALAAARQWVFTPALTNGHPVMVWVAQMFVYRIQ